MAAASPSARHASSSLDPEAGYDHVLYPDGDAQETPAFPSLTPLSHDLELLSPAQNPNFSVDDFLLSRTKASDLNFILSDLRNYSEKLKDELYSIINHDYKDFVSLGSSLKSEAHRIARLGWTSRSDSDQVAQPGLMAPVRDTLLASKSILKSVQDDIQDCIKRREDATSQKAQLELMLQLNDSIARLEDLLLIQHDKTKRDRRRSSHAARRPSVLSIGPMGERRGSLASVASGSDQELSDYAMSSDYEEESDTDSDTDELGRSNHDHQPRPSRRKFLRRLSSGPHFPRSDVHNRDPALSPSRTRPRTGTLTMTGATSSSSASSSLLGLPQRIARTSAEYSRLRFLHRRIEEEDLTHYADALQDRIETVRSVLRQDLRTLLRALISPASLLAHGQSSAKLPSSPELRKSSSASRPTAGNARRTSFLQGLSTKPQRATIHEGAISELDAWSQIAEPVEEGAGAETSYWEARLEEQRSWLEMTLSTLNTLPLVKDQGTSADGLQGDVKRRNEAEEAVRDLLVSEWALKLIVDKAQPEEGSHTTKDLPDALQAQFQEHRDYVQSILLSAPASSPLNPLVKLYNSILTFASTTAWHVSDASREISLVLSNSTDDTATKDRCDIFTNVVWDELSSRLLDVMGNTIFFVGQTDTFFSNFTLTNAFLQRFLSLAPSPESKRAMLDHPNWANFKRRWQLPVYFQMRFREVVGQLEASLNDGVGGRNLAGIAKNGSGETRCMTATDAFLKAIERVWSDGVHIHELSAREWRVTLQILSRFKTWVEEQSPNELALAGGGLGGGGGNRQIDAIRAGAAGAGGDGSRRSSMDQRPGSNEISRVGTPQPPADLSSQQHEDEQLHFSVQLLSDCLYLHDQVDQLLDVTILPKISSNLEISDEEGKAATDGGDAIEGLRSDLMAVLNEESFDFISGLNASVGRFAYGILSPRSAASLRLLRSFSTPAYRSASSAHTSANTAIGAAAAAAGGGAAATIQVIHQIFRPLETFLHLESVRSGLPTSTKRVWMEKILSDVFKRYANTVETINKNQQSLIRLKKSQAPSGGGGGGGLLGMFSKTSSSSSTAAAANKETAGASEESIMETNQQALQTFQDKVKALDLQIDLDSWEAWTKLKDFLESDFDQ